MKGQQMHIKTDLIKRLLCIAIVGECIVLFSSPSHAGTYYVSPAGNAAWSACTNINSSCSWQTAMANAVAGDIVYFRSGTYDPGTSCPSEWDLVGITPQNSGTATNPITFKAYPGENPVILSCADSMPAFGAVNVSYIVWDGFSGTTVDNPTGEDWFFLYWNSTGSVVKNCKFTGNARTIYKNGAPLRIEQSSNNEVANNYIQGMTGNSNAVNTAAIWLFDTKGALVHNNTIFNCMNGIMQKTGPNVNNAIYKNFIYSITISGISLNEEAVGGSGDIVYQNVLVNNAYIAIDVYPQSGTGEYQTNYQIYNNTVYGSGTGIEIGPNARTNQIWNNIIQLVSASNPIMRYYTGASIPSYSDYNDFYSSRGVWNLNYATDYSSLTAWTAATGFDADSVTTDPQFILAGGTSPANYKRKSYPANGKGGTVMGAYITGTESIGRIPPPMNLR
jgi:copper-binding protein NosD